MAKHPAPLPLDEQTVPGGAAEASSAAPSRRSFLGVGAALAGGAGAGLVGYGLGNSQTGVAPSAVAAASSEGAAPDAPWAGSVIPFIGAHQAGISTPPQAHATFVALNLTPGVGQDGLRRLLRQWTNDASRLQRGIPVLGDPQPDLASPPSRLTVTVGLGRGALAEAGLLERAPAWLAPPARLLDRQARATLERRRRARSGVCRRPDRPRTCRPGLAVVCYGHRHSPLATAGVPAPSHLNERDA